MESGTNASVSYRNVQNSARARSGSASAADRRGCKARPKQVNWWRAHHGISHDPKLALVAKRAKAKKCEVMAVWISLLDYASQQEERGSISGIDYEEISFQTDISYETLQRIMSQFRQKQMLDESRLAAWEKRQYGDSSTERVKRFRENKALNSECNAVKRNETDETRHETPVTLETPRADTEQIQNRAEGETRPRLREVPKGLPDPGCQDFEVRFDRLYMAHPKTGFQVEAKIRYTEIVASAVMPDATADLIDKTHGIWLAFWRANPSEFVPSLAKWFEDKYYLKGPMAREPPKKAWQQKTWDDLSEEERAFALDKMAKHDPLEIYKQELAQRKEGKE